MIHGNVAIVTINILMDFNNLLIFWVIRKKSTFTIIFTKNSLYKTDDTRDASEVKNNYE